MILPPRSRQKQRESDEIASLTARFLKKGNRIQVLGTTPLREGKSLRDSERAKLELIKDARRAAKRKRKSDDEE